MTSETARAVESIATLYGVETAWVDAEGRRRTAAPDVVVEVLRRLGAPVDGEADLADAARHRRREIWERVCPPVRIVALGEAASVPLRLPAERTRGPLEWLLALEEGGARAGDARLEACALGGGSTVDGRRFEIRRLALPEGLPAGRHRLTLRHGAAEYRLPLIVAPERTYHGGRGGRLEGGWGAFHPLYGLRSGRDAGVGDFGTLREALAWVAERGGVAFGTTPLLALFQDPPLDPSPYAPASRLFWDDRYVELTAVPGFAEARAAGELEMLDGLAGHRSDELVPWEPLTRARHEVLSILARRFFAAGGERTADFRRFLADRPAAGEFARFLAARAAWGADWRSWPEPARSGRLPAEALDGGLVRRHLFGQWQAARQLAAAAGATPGVALYLDIPLGAHPDGYDVWRHRDLFATGVAAGAPPDDFFRGGQDWGLPPLHPERIREDGFAHVAAVLRHVMRPAGLVRIDHVMQLHRLFWIPRGAEASEGVYVRYPAEELAAVVVLESHRAACEVVGEDLGTVPDAVRELMERRGIRRTAVLGFSLEQIAASGGVEIPAGSVATIETHDMVPLAGLRAGVDVHAREDAELLDAAEADALRSGRDDTFARLDERFGVGAAEGTAAEVGGAAYGADPLLAPLLDALGRSPAGIVVVPLDDLFGLRRPQNVPGPSDGRPNWRRRLPVRLGAGLPPAGERALEVLRALRGAGPGGVAAGAVSPPDG